MDDSTPHTRLRRRWLSVPRLFFGLLLIGVAALAWIEYRARTAGDEELPGVIAKLDATDPGWRLIDIELDRADVPDDENSGPLIVAAHQQVPADFWQADAIEA